MSNDFQDQTIESQINSLDENSGKMHRLGISKRALYYLSAESDRVSILNHEIGFQLKTLVLVAIEFCKEK